MNSKLWLISGLACGACRSHAPVPTPSNAPASADAAYVTRAMPLPGANAEGIFMDYLLYDSRTNAVWVPAGNTASVDVVDVATGKISRIEGFATQEMERRGRKRVVGPSSATLGAPGTVYVGNRGDSSVCAFDERSLHKTTCATLDAMPDGIAYVDKTHEVWVTTPRDKSIRVLDATTLAQKARVAFEGEPEGFAPDNARGRFYTNLEDKDVTLAIDLDTHETKATWPSHCGEEGPHGLRLVDPEGWLVVACSARVETLDVAHDGAALGSVETGDGVDDVDYSATTHRVYVGAAKAGQLTVASLDAKGGLTADAHITTEPGARNGVVTGDGQVYLASSKSSSIIVATPSRP
jgi:DNA-binding beta-propeller fold protein YncE